MSLIKARRTEGEPPPELPGDATPSRTATRTGISTAHQTVYLVYCRRTLKDRSNPPGGSSPRCHDYGQRCKFWTCSRDNCCTSAVALQFGDQNHRLSRRSPSETRAA